MPRAVGALALASKKRNTTSAIDTLYQSGCLRALFPQGGGLDVTILNTSGGITGGDRLNVDLTAGAGSFLTATTQAAERAYRANTPCPGKLGNRLTIEDGATLHWLPQELILFDGAHFTRRLEIDMAKDASLLFVEPVVFGRAAMRERLHDASFQDEIVVRKDGQPVYIDGMNLVGDISNQLTAAGLTHGAGAIASALLIQKDASAVLPWIQTHLPKTAGVSLLADDIVSLRFLAQDSYLLRKSMVPILTHLRGAPLPTSWRL